MKNLNQMKQTAISAIRVLSMDAIQKANSGHPGMPLGSAPMAFELFANHLKHSPHNPNWANRDRFVLSAGHASMLLYSLLHLFDYGLGMEDLKNFRQWDSKTPGHPEYGHTVGVDATSGPLGQGIAMATGMAMAEAHLAARFNTADFKVIDHYTYALTGDGCLMEGVSAEASSLAGQLELGKLIVLYDRNKITIEGSTDLAFSEDVKKRYEAYGWQVLEVADGNDTQAISEQIQLAKTETKKPSLIIIKTKIGYGSPLAGSEQTHGAPLGPDNIAKTKDYLGWPKELADFELPVELKEYMQELVKVLNKKEADYQEGFKLWEQKNKELAKEYQACFNQELPDLRNDEKFWDFSGSAATRKTSGQVLNYLAKKLPNLFGGSADLAPSNNSWLEDKETFSPKNYAGSNIHYGIREFAMTAAVNGISLHGGLRPFCSTFFVFSDYMKAALRLSALMNIPGIFILTHDSIGVGEDGPTHEPIEHLAMLRATPNLTVFRPADGKETAAAYLYALESQRPVVLALSRQNLPTYENSGKAALKGAYVLEDRANFDLIIMASGSELELATKTAASLEKEGIMARVVSVPSLDLFLEQDSSYQEEVLPSACKKRLAIEAAATMPWYRLTGLEGKVLGLDHFGASAPADRIFAEFGFTVENAKKLAKEILA